MSRIYVCNSYSDSISEIDCGNMESIRKIKLSTADERVGPHGICRYKNNLIVANKHKGSISILDLSNYGKEEYYIGSNCSDVKVYKDKAYVVCSDSNDIKIFDFLEKRVQESIPCGHCPKNIHIDIENQEIMVNNFMENSISIIDLKDHENNKKVIVGEYPGKVIYSPVNNMYIVTTSFMGRRKNGYVKFLGKNFKSIGEIEVGKSPVDFCIYNEKVYVGNFENGTISVLDLMYMKKIEDIKVYGMPRGIQVLEDNLYVADYYGNCLNKINLITKEKTKTTTGNEPTAVVIL
ncbi:40-residue YVTN family beta-propeller repeat-containing protein [Hathewaya proteolytica DSM 3090]|uniref:40-residue YVTN family beta-propeller repeat-containing protein n=1 Tax=Hathewaya proteolytica DSM 3090 TaxID=1121331 RepID=A0A1M6SG74_9CLOT|nr:YncE family protein [Hathewaya proteolytica]SHK43685.1 40-residue YVTN family beta-propeller repeat-containing protein [Hathewaya proteolytica DSM 3090]